MHDHYVGSPHLKDWKVSEKRCLLDRILRRILGIYGLEAQRVCFKYSLRAAPRLLKRQRAKHIAAGV